MWYAVANFFSNLSHQALDFHQVADFRAPIWKNGGLGLGNNLFNGLVVDKDDYAHETISTLDFDVILLKITSLRGLMDVDSWIFFGSMKQTITLVNVQASMLANLSQPI